MKHQLYFYKDAGSNFIVVHKYLEDGRMMRYGCGQNEHGLDLIVREGHDETVIRRELEEAVKTMNFSKWIVFEDAEEEMELTHFETCMGPVEKAYAFIIEWN